MNQILIKYTWIINMLNFIKNLFTNQKPEDVELREELGKKRELSKDDAFALELGEKEVNRCLELAKREYGVNAPRYAFDTRMQTYIIDKFFKLNEFEAREQQLAEREAKIIKIEAAQRITNSELVEQIIKEMYQA